MFRLTAKWANITSLCDEGAIHHYGEAITSLRLAATSLFTNDFEAYARKVIDRAYFLILNKIDELDGTNEKLLEYYQKHIEKCIKL